MMKSSYQTSSQEEKSPVEENAKEMIKRVLVVAALIAKVKHEGEAMQINELQSGGVTQEDKALVL